MTRDEAFNKLAQGHELDEECKRIIANEWGFYEPCEDALSRETVLYVLERTRNMFSNADDAMQESIDFISALPPVQPKANAREPRIVVYSGDGYADGNIVYDFAECPNCGYEYEDGDKDWKEPFCPHCGQALKWEVEE